MVEDESFAACSPQGACSLDAQPSKPETAQSRLPPVNLRLDIVSDTICPWCYIGKRKLADALEILRGEGLTFDVTWRPFQLNPDMPKGGVDRRQYRSRKFGSWEKSQALDAQVAAAGRSVGLDFHHERMEKTPNTVASHILIQLAKNAGGAVLQDTIVESLFEAYFTEGRDVGDPEVLGDLGASAGLGRDAVKAALADLAQADAVAREEGLARRLSLNGVPSFVLEGHYLFSGAQPVEVIVQALRDTAAALASNEVSATIVEKADVSA